MATASDNSLGFRNVEAALRARARGSFLARHPLLLLDHPRVDLSPLDAVSPIQFEGEVERFPDDLGVLCRRSSFCHHTREALTTEVSSLARLLASLAINRYVSLDLGVLDPEETADKLRGRQEKQVVVVIQHLTQTESDVSGQRYRSALSQPDRILARDPRMAMVAWGSPDDVARQVASYLRQEPLQKPLATALLVAGRTTLAPLGEHRSVPAVGDMIENPAPVVLLSAPFAPLEYPSLGLSLLRETISETRPPILYLSIPFAETIGPSVYSWISGGRPHFKALLGEWIFGCVLDASRRREPYLEEVLCEDSLAWFRTIGEERPVKLVDFLTLAEIHSVIDAATASIDDWTSQILRARPGVVAFTSVFQQHAASLALAKSIKSQRPETITLFGGSNCEGEMGLALVSNYQFADVVVSGEAEVVFPEVIGRLLQGRGVEGLSGVHTASGVKAYGPPRNAPLPEIDDLPFPDYYDFFDQWNRSPVSDTFEPRLFFETSRGCWWGEKNHCTFCGLNGFSMAFRSKRPERALEEIDRLCGRHPGHMVAAVDNILDTKYFPTLVQSLAERGTKTDIFYEVKANLKKEQVVLLKKAGISHLQPGIESLSDHVLHLMAKGVSTLQNVQLIKWCTELGILPYWNILWGFPGESADDYRRMAALIPLLTHLVPPSGAGPIRIDRFSPNHFDSERLGFKNVKATRSYSFVYDLDPDELDRLAYYFDGDYVDDRGDDLEESIVTLWQEVGRWRAVHATSRLVHFTTDESILVFDNRPCAVEPVHVLEGDDRTIFEQIDCVRSTRKLTELVGSERETLAAIGRLRERRLLAQVDGRVVSLSLCGLTRDREHPTNASRSDYTRKE